MARLRLSLCRGFLYLAVGLAVCELVILNFTIVYVYFSVQSEFARLFSGAEEGQTFVDNLLKIPTIRNVVYAGKSGGFLKLIQNTLERVYIVTENRECAMNRTSLSPFSNFDRSQFSFLSVDVSHSGEVLYLIRRIKQKGEKFSTQYKLLVVDIGANDGLMSSNSFNLIQLGWDAILVEPQIGLLQQAKQNIERYSDPHNEGKQKIILVNCVIGASDGSADFVLLGDDMESHIYDAQRAQKEGKHNKGGQLIVTVPSMTVRTFARKYHIPKNFAILSIDAEGIGDKILHQWIESGYRPAYILYEQLHNKEPIMLIAAFMKRSGYRFLIKLGWNLIYEFKPHEESVEDYGGEL